MNYFLDFLAGIFLCNAIPHVVSGLLGRPFPSPFARPPGRGNSSPLVNFLWGSLNLLVGLLLLPTRVLGIGVNLDFATLAAGFLLTGIFLALHFGKVNRDRAGG